MIAASEYTRLFWNEYKLNPERIDYNITFQNSISGDLQLDKLKESLKQLVKNNVLFNSVLLEVNDELFWKQNDKIEELKIYADTSFLQDFVYTPFDLENGPLYRFGVFINDKTEYEFVIVLHHILIDGASFDEFIDQVSKYYNDDNLIIDITQQAHEIEKINENLNYHIKELQAHNSVDFWSNALADMETTNNLPIIGNNNYTDNEIGSYEFEINKTTQSFNIILAAWGVLIARYSGDVIAHISYPIKLRSANRLIYGAQINTLILPVVLEPEMTYAGLMTNILNFIKSAIINSNNKHFHLPINQILSNSPIKRLNVSCAQTNLKNKVFSFTNCESRSNNLYNLDIAGNDISLIYEEVDKVFNFKILYKKKLYTKDYIKQVKNHFEKILHDLINEPDKLILKSSLLLEHEYDRVLLNNSMNYTSYSRDKSILDLFEETVAKYPHNIAVSYENKSISYQQLNEKAQDIAALIQSYGVATNDLVGIVINNSLEMIIAVVAVIKSGAAYLPIAYDTPDDRLNFILNDSGAKAILTVTDYLSKIIVTTKVINLDNNCDAIEYRRPNVRASDLLYVIYTSGTTGKPKGALLEHCGVINYVNFLIQDNNINENTAGLKYAGFGFDASVSEIYPIILSGGKLCIVPDEKKMDVLAIHSFINLHKISYAFLPTQFAEVFFETENIFLKNVIVGGDKLRKYSATSTCNIKNGYGPTEATVQTTQFVVDKFYENIPIGKPLPNYTCYVVDKQNQLVPMGVVGELLIGGDGVARGYLNRVELTKEKFIKNPFQSDKDKSRSYNAVLYKSGDLVRYLPDGNLEFLGRNDFQIKIRGYRIEIGEIETALQNLVGVLQITVIAYSNEGDNYLCAYYTGTKLKVLDIQNELARTLPSYMIPEYIIWLDAFPINTSGKINRSLLPIPDLNVSQTEYIAPISLYEKFICSAYATVLMRDKIGMNDDFFNNGGNSITALKLINLLRSKFVIVFKDLHTYRTPRKLINSLVKLESNEKIVNKLGKQDLYDVTNNQLRVILATEKLPNSILYNIPLKFKIEGPLNLELLGKSIDELILRHSSLRTRFVVKNEQIYQTIDETNKVRKDYISLSKEEIDQAFRNFVKPFDLFNDTLCRVQIIKVASSEHYLFFDFHHAIMDGYSVNILTDNLKNIFSGKEISMADIDYVDFANWKKFQKSDDKNSKYWLNQINSVEIESLNLPFDYSKKDLHSDVGMDVSVYIDAKKIDDLTNLCNKLGVSKYSITLFAFNILLYKYTSQKHIVISAVTNGRTHTQLENIVGMFVNTLPFISNFEKNNKLKHFLLNTHENVLGMLDHQDYDIENLFEQTGLQNSIFDVVFNYLEAFRNVSLSDNVSLQPMIQSLNIAKFNLSLTCQNYEDKLEFTFNYAVDLFKSETILRLANHYLNILDSLLKLDLNNNNLSDIDILSPDEKKQLLFDFNSTYTCYPRDKSILDLFEEIVAKYPNNVAIVDQYSTLTYSQLLEKVELCATLLSSSGVQNGDFIAILSDRTHEFYIMLLATLYLGACFIPLDKTYPKQRIMDILDDSNAFLITNINEFKIDYSKSIYLKYDITTAKIDRATVLSDDLSCVIYTSGSTGKPKGAMLTQKNLINFSHCYMKYRALDPGESYAVYASFGFDAGAIMGTFPTLFTGGAIHIIPDNIKLNLEAVKDFIIKNNIVGCFFTTVIAEEFIKLYDIKTVRFIECGGEKLSRFIPRSYNFYNGYGPTECTVYSTQMLVKQNVENIPIGKPLDNYTCYIVNDDMQIQPIGVVGELLIGGDGVGAGYLNRPDLTQEKFIKNPFQNENDKALNYNHLLYRTGDLVKWLPDGNIEYIGRNDFQVKIRGYRIEIGEIEYAFTQLNGVNQVIIVPIKNGSQYVDICAYYTGDKLLEDEIRLQLSQSLASFMIPAYIIWLDEFPLNVNGKVDRKKLPEPTLSHNFTEYKEPESLEETLICNTYAEILGKDKVGVHDDFFKIGGSSIKTVSLVSKLKVNFKVEVSDVYKYKTPNQLALHIKFVKNNLSQQLEIVKTIYKNNAENITSQNVADSYKPSELQCDFGLLKKIDTVLLTGATGYLGCSILYHLLESTNYNVLLLVRAQSDVDAYSRINKKFQFYFDKDLNNYKHKLHVRAADLEAVNFALTDDVYNKLTMKVDSIIHAAALVKHYGDYEIFYKANVQATTNLIEFAKLTAKPDIHYISTYSVLQDGYIDGLDEAELDETSTADDFINRKNVYVQTKYEGEVVVRKSQASGVNWNIYRVGNLSMISINNKPQENIEDNGFYSRFKSMLNLGVYTDLTSISELSPVDSTALAIVKLFDKKVLTNQIFHVYNPQKYNIMEMLVQANILCHTKLDVNDFIDKLKKMLSYETYQKIVEIFMLHQGWLSEDFNKFNVIIKQDRTHEILEKLGFKWPRLTVEYFQLFLRSAFNDRIQYLSSNIFAKRNTEIDIYELARYLVPCYYDKEQVVVDNNSKSAKIVFIQNGFVESYIKSNGGWNTSLMLLSDGDIFNIESLFNSNPDLVYESVFDGVTTLELPEEIYNKIFSQNINWYKLLLNKMIEDNVVLKLMYACLK